MIDALDDRTRHVVFAELVEVATVADAKRIRQHPGYQEGQAATSAQVVPQERRVQNNPQQEA